MTFTWPIALLGLVAVPLIVALYIWMQRRRRADALRYSSVSMVALAIGAGPGIKRHIPMALYLVAVSVLIVALARPKASIPVPQSSGTVILSIDVSGSMWATDVKPDRMEAAKTAVRDFINKEPGGVKIGIVAFSDYAALLSPPTADHQQLLSVVSRLSPQRGTNIGDGLQVAFDSLVPGSDTGSATPTVVPSQTAPTPVTSFDPKTTSIVLLSDGQSNTGPDPLQVASEVAKAGVKVYTVGIGTPEGTVLRIQGRNVFTQLDEGTLKGIAQQTGGHYFNAQDEVQLRQVYSDLAHQREIVHKTTELTFAAAGLALVLVILAGGLSLVWLNRLP